MNKAITIQNKISLKLFVAFLLSTILIFGAININTEKIDFQLRTEKTSGKNEPHANQQAKEAAKAKYQQIKKEYQQLKSKPNKTPNDKNKLKKLYNQLKKWKQKTDFKGENHSKTGKGYK